MPKPSLNNLQEQRGERVPEVHQRAGEIGFSHLWIGSVISKEPMNLSAKQLSASLHRRVGYNYKVLAVGISFLQWHNCLQDLVLSSL